MKIGHMDIAAGQKCAFDLAVGETALKPITVPCTVIRGAQDGPTVAITAACHPMELNGILATVRLAERLDPATMAGTVVMVHVQNVMGFELKRGHASPLDGINMGKAFPVFGAVVEDTGSVSHQGRSLSYMAAETIFEQVIKPADYLIDMHGGELHEQLAENIEILMTGDEQTNLRTRDFARSFGFDLIWEVPQGSIPEMPSYPERGGAVMEAMKNGIPAVFCEVGSEGKLDVTLVEKTIDGVLNVLKTLKMIEGEARIGNPRTLVGGHVLFARRGGLFLNRCTAGDVIAAGQVLGEIVSLKGETIEELTSPQAGVISNTITLGIANPGDMLYVIGNTV